MLKEEQMRNGNKLQKLEDALVKQTLIAADRADQAERDDWTDLAEVAEWADLADWADQADRADGDNQADCLNWMDLIYRMN